MVKRATGFVVCVLLLLPLGGCWNYRGLNEMTIVAGIAIDRNPANGNYMLSFEIIDLTSSSPEEGMQAKLIEAEGRTLFDAARNAKKRLVNKLYFGNTQMVVLSQKLAAEEDIGGIIDWFFRDAECRETICAVVSQEETARELLSIYGIGNAIVAYEMFRIAETDHQITASTAYVELYEIYNILRAPGIALTLPAFHNVINDEEPASEANGIAVFKGERLSGYLTPEESKYFLYATDQVQGGVLSFRSSGEGEQTVSLEISSNKTRSSFGYKDGKLKITVKTETEAYLNESSTPFDALDAQAVEAIEADAERDLAKNIKKVVARVQSEFNSDIFGFGNQIYQRDYRLWTQLSEDWERLFPTLQVEILPNVKILNSSFLKTS